MLSLSLSDRLFILTGAGVSAEGRVLKYLRWAVPQLFQNGGYF
jgi:hypothetical protein